VNVEGDTVYITLSTEAPNLPPGIVSGIVPGGHVLSSGNVAGGVG
jgi:hypothetical protein